MLTVYEHHAYYTVNPKIIVDRIINKLNNNLFKIINYTRCYSAVITASCVQKKQRVKPYKPKKGKIRWIHSSHKRPATDAERTLTVGEQCRCSILTPSAWLAPTLNASGTTTRRHERPNAPRVRRETGTSKGSALNETEGVCGHFSSPRRKRKR